jgi:Flp pilus assembly protein TadD
MHRFAARSALMRVGLFRVLVIAASCLTGLAACETSKNGLAQIDNGPQTTGSIAYPAGDADGTLVSGETPSSTGLLGDDLKDDLNLGKKYYRENNFGLAEKHFRRAVESSAKDLEAWVGLAASYDKLRRFDLADRAYEQAIVIGGPMPEILNNQGYSYMLRGDYRRARAKLLAAQAKDPANPFIQNNLDLLNESERKAKSVK